MYIGEFKIYDKTHKVFGDTLESCVRQAVKYVREWRIDYECVGRILPPIVWQVYNFSTPNTTEARGYISDTGEHRDF